jgi:hypothetical protein
LLSASFASSTFLIRARVGIRVVLFSLIFMVTIAGTSPTLYAVAWDLPGPSRAATASLRGPIVTRKTGYRRARSKPCNSPCSVKYFVSATRFQRSKGQLHVGHLNCPILTKARSESVDGAPLVMGCSGGFSSTPAPPPSCHRQQETDIRLSGETFRTARHLRRQMLPTSEFSGVFRLTKQCRLLA